MLPVDDVPVWVAMQAHSGHRDGEKTYTEFTVL